MLMQESRCADNQAFPHGASRNEQNVRAAEKDELGLLTQPVRLRNASV